MEEKTGKRGVEEWSILLNKKGKYRVDYAKEQKIV